MRLLIRPEFVYIAVTAVFWGGYPLVTRAAGVGSAMGSLILTASALVPIVAVVLWQGALERPPTGDLLRLIVAGLMMGVGLIAFNAVVSSRQIDASISIPIVDTAMMLVSVVAALIFFAEPLTAKKLLGLGLLIAGIAVLRPE